MSESSTYQKLRSHLAYLRLAAAAEALPGTLEHAHTNQLSHTAFLEQLLDVEVAATGRSAPHPRGLPDPSSRPGGASTI